MKIGMHIILRARSMGTNASMSQGQYKRNLGTCILLASVVGSPHLVTEFACAVSYAHVYPLCSL